MLPVMSVPCQCAGPPHAVGTRSRIESDMAKGNRDNQHIVFMSNQNAIDATRNDRQTSHLRKRLDRHDASRWRTVLALAMPPL